MLKVTGEISEEIAKNFEVTKCQNFVFSEFRNSETEPLIVTIYDM